MRWRVWHHFRLKNIYFSAGIKQLDDSVRFPSCELVREMGARSWRSTKSTRHTKPFTVVWQCACLLWTWTLNKSQRTYPPQLRLISNLSEAREQAENGLHNKEAAAAWRTTELQRRGGTRSQKRCTWRRVGVFTKLHGVRYVCAVLTSILERIHKLHLPPSKEVSCPGGPPAWHVVIVKPYCK